MKESGMAMEKMVDMDYVLTNDNLILEGYLGYKTDYVI